jgi:glycosyltransferase involved in cell wall biosynthesis
MASMTDERTLRERTAENGRTPNAGRGSRLHLPAVSGDRDQLRSREELRSLARPPVDLEVIIPAFNEERRLPETVEATIDHLAGRRSSSAIVVVNNDSVDSTLEVLARFDSAKVPVYVIGCSDRGKGAAVRRGISTSLARFVGFIDADNATPIATLDLVMELLEAGYDAVIGSRRAPGARYAVVQPLGRRAGGAVFRKLERLILPGITDTQCGFKFFDGPLARAIVNRCRINGFAFDVEFLLHISRAGRSVVEVPVIWSDVPGSTFSARKHGLRTLVDLLWLGMFRIPP